MKTSATGIARALAQRVEREGAPGWFLLEQGGSFRPRSTVLGIASHVTEVASGSERLLTEALDGTSATAHVVIVGYEFNRPHATGADTVPVALLLAAPVRIVIEHETGEVHLEHDPGAPTELLTWHRQALVGAEHPVTIQPQREISWRFADAEYERLIERATAVIDSSEIEVLCLTNRATTDAHGLDVLDTFIRLQELSEAPRAGLIVAGEHALISASPETFFEFYDQTVTTSPMKGTRSRGRNSREDQALKEELGRDPKELAENRAVTTEIVDSLIAVCESGSVRVTEDSHVYTFQQVHQLVSTVQGRFASNDSTNLVRVLRALSPSASMTGVPAQRAIHTLEAFEQGPRGWYSGCFGYVNRDASEAEFAVTIRSIEVHHDVATVGAGGGVTKRSVPAREVAEMHLKARATLAALTRYS